MPDDLVQAYNYDAFVPASFERWMRFASSPPLGEPGPDFPLWTLSDGTETCLSTVWHARRFTIVELGSFT